jgi:hypothetical protein
MVKQKMVDLRACPQCWTPDQPQLQVGMRPVIDPQALRDPRPDTTYFVSGPNAAGNMSEGSRQIYWGWNPVGFDNSEASPSLGNTLVGVGQIGTVTVVTEEN